VSSTLQSHPPASKALWRITARQSGRLDNNQQANRHGDGTHPGTRHVVTNQAFIGFLSILPVTFGLHFRYVIRNIFDSVGISHFRNRAVTIPGLIDPFSLIQSENSMSKGRPRGRIFSKPKKAFTSVVLRQRGRAESANRRRGSVFKSRQHTLGFSENVEQRGFHKTKSLEVLKTLKGPYRSYSPITPRPLSLYTVGSWRRGSESVASSVVSAPKMPDFADESSTTPSLPGPALSQHLC